MRGARRGEISYFALLLLNVESFNGALGGVMIGRGRGRAHARASGQANVRPVKHDLAAQADHDTTAFQATYLSILYTSSFTMSCVFLIVHKFVLDVVRVPFLRDTHPTWVSLDGQSRINSCSFIHFRW